MCTIIKTLVVFVVFSKYAVLRFKFRKHAMEIVKIFVYVCICVYVCSLLTNNKTTGLCLVMRFCCFWDLWCLINFAINFVINSVCYKKKQNWKGSQTSGKENDDNERQTSEFNKH